MTVTSEPFAGEHSVEVHLPFVHRALGDVEIVPVLVGQAPPKQVSDVLGLLWGGPETAIVVSLPIRLTPMTATCRVPPLSRVKLGIGWSRGVARDAEQ